MVSAENVVTLPERKLFVLRSEHLNTVSLSRYPYNDPEFHAVFAPETAEIGTDGQLAMLRRVTVAGIRPDTLLADRQGKAVYAFSKGRISGKRLREAAALPDYTDDQNIMALIETCAETYAVTVFDFSRSDALRTHTWNGPVRVVPLFEEGALAAYLRHPEPQYQTRMTAAVPVAVPQPEAATAPAESSSAVPVAAEKSPELLDAEIFLEKTWAKAFNLDGEIGHDEDFFSLGGNSLIMQSMSNEINEYFHKKFDIFEIYDYETIEKLAVKILEEDAA